jgi:organic radical activating enzyme
VGYGDVQIETNGTLWHPCMGAFDACRNFFIVVSPKTGSVHKEIASRAAAWKYVARAGDIDDIDGLPRSALGHPAAPFLFRPPANGTRVYLQPADEYSAAANADNQRAVIASCLANGYIYCHQLHKTIGVP